MARFFSRLLIGLGVLFLLLLIAAIVGASLFTPAKPGVPDHVILEADFSYGLAEYIPDDPLALAMNQQPTTLHSSVEALRRAAHDDRVSTLIARVGGGFGLPAKVEELRDAILYFRSQGKQAIAWVETFPYGNAGVSNYYLASAFDRIHMLPIGDLSIGGLAMEAVFVKGALDKLGLEPEFDHRHEYKNFLNTFTETQFTEPHRESYQRIIASQFQQIADDIAEDRGFGAQQMDALASQGLFSANDALAAGLIDAIGYRDEAYAYAKAQSPDGAELLYLDQYGLRSAEPQADAPVIALIYGVGNVVQGSSDYDPLSGSLTMGSDSVSQAFRNAVADDDVDAIIFRIDSGGGSAVASQLMWRETLQAQQQGKPVIASMGDVAGSGGYFVAMGADKIVAQPTTITGSIGVVSGKMVTREFWDELGISFDEVRTHDNASMWNSIRKFTPEQSAQFQQALDRIYEIFTQGVADGRDLPIETVNQIAKGRIWTGADAKELGLVDALGGFDKALELAKQVSNIDADTDVTVRVYPRAKTPFEAVMEILEGQQGSNSEQAVVSLARQVVQSLRPISQLLQKSGLSDRHGVLQMPPLPQR